VIAGGRVFLPSVFLCAYGKSPIAALAGQKTLMLKVAWKRNLAEGE
jgi:hypothetical protein